MKTITEYLVNNHIYKVDYHLWDRINIDGVPCTVVCQGTLKDSVIVLSDYYATNGSFYNDNDVNNAGYNIIKSLSLNFQELTSAYKKFKNDGWRLPHEDELSEYKLFAKFGSKIKSAPKIWVTVGEKNFAYYCDDLGKYYVIDEKSKYHSYFLRFIKEIQG